MARGRAFPQGLGVAGRAKFVTGRNVDRGWPGNGCEITSSISAVRPFWLRANEGEVKQKKEGDQCGNEVMEQTESIVSAITGASRDGGIKTSSRSTYESGWLGVIWFACSGEV